MPFNTLQYRSVPFNGTLDGKKDNERYTIEQVPLGTIQYRAIPFGVIENVNGKCIGLDGNLNGKK